MLTLVAGSDKVRFPSQLASTSPQPAHAQLDQAGMTTINVLGKAVNVARDISIGSQTNNL